MSESIEQDLTPPQNVEIPDQLPLLPVRDIVVFPYMVLPLFVGRAGGQPDDLLGDAKGPRRREPHP